MSKKCGIRVFTLVIVAGLLALSSYGQTAQESVITVQGYATPAEASANFPGGVFGERASIVPVRMMPGYDPWIGAYDRVSYLVVRQATPYEYGTNVAEAGLPLASGTIGITSSTIGTTTWNLAAYTVNSTCPTFSCAWAFYSSLDWRQRATAYLLATPATNHRWVVVYQLLIAPTP